MARSQKKRCDVPSFAAVPTQPDPTTNTICVRTRSPSPSGFLSATLCSSTLRSARSSSGVIVDLAEQKSFRAKSRNPVALPRVASRDPSTPLRSAQDDHRGSVQRFNGFNDSMLLFRPFRRRRFVSKFAMSDSSAGVGDVNPASQRYGTEQDHRNGEWDGRLCPFDWRSDGNCAQSDQCIENPDEIFAALFVFIEPGLSILVCH